MTTPIRSTMSCSSSTYRIFAAAAMSRSPSTTLRPTHAPARSQWCNPTRSSSSTASCCLNFKAMRALIDLAVFIDIDENLRLERRAQRDVRERGRDVDDVHRQFWATVAPMHDKFVRPSAVHADRVVTVDERLETLARELAAEITALLSLNPPIGLW